jgi:hypothetical protein
MFGYRLLGFGSGGAADPEADYLVVAGGGGGQTGGGGAGGYRTSFPGGTKMVLEKGTSFPVTVGAGGPNGDDRGTNSSMVGDFTINSTGGGRGGPVPNQPFHPPPWGAKSGYPGGSGGGAAQGNPQAGGGTGNAGSYDPPEGKGGGQNYSSQPGGGGGGGASQGGTSSNAIGGTDGGKGGDGSPNTISGSDVTYAGGGASVPGNSGANGAGGGPTGIGGGGKQGTGGTGTVILRGPAAVTFTVAPGTNTTSTAPNGEKIATFTVSGTVTTS